MVKAGEPTADKRMCCWKGGEYKALDLSAEEQKFEDMHTLDKHDVFVLHWMVGLRSLAHRYCCILCCKGCRIQEDQLSAIRPSCGGRWRNICGLNGPHNGGVLDHSKYSASSELGNLGTVT